MSDNISESSELDFNSEDYNGFYYTLEKQIRKIDDEFILSKITEKYPDLRKDNDDSILKQVILVIMADSRLLQKLEKEFELPSMELIKILYRNYEFIFNKCFISKVHKTVKNRAYAKGAVRKTDSRKSKCSKRIKRGTSRKIL